MQTEEAKPQEETPPEPIAEPEVAEEKPTEITTIPEKQDDDKPPAEEAKTVENGEAAEEVRINKNYCIVYIKKNFSYKGERFEMSQVSLG